MQANDILMKKWCFGTGRSKAREEAVMGQNGELQTYRTYPKYRTIVFKVEKATFKKGINEWTVEGKQYSSLNGKPKKRTLVLQEKNGLLYAPKQKRPFLKMQNPGMLTEEGLPPVGSLSTVNKKHAIVTAVGRNQLTVFVNNKIQTITCRPGTIKWHSDKILASAVK